MVLAASAFHCFICSPNVDYVIPCYFRTVEEQELPLITTQRVILLLHFDYMFYFTFVCCNTSVLAAACLTHVALAEV